MDNRNVWYPSSLDAWDWDAIIANANDVFARWQALLADESPWREMREDDVNGYMRAVISELLNEAREPRDGVRDSRMLTAAAEHGYFRRRQQCAPAVVRREFEALRVAIEASLRDAAPLPELVGAVAESMIVLEPEIQAVSAIAACGWDDRREVC